MKIGLSAMRSGANFGGWGDRTSASVKVTQLAEKLGYDSVWTSEVMGTDAVVPLSWLAANTSTIKVGTAVMQMTARTPSVTAQTAATLDHMSDGRLILGLGPSGPGLVEGWHGEPYASPLVRTREYVEVVRQVLNRRGELKFHGDVYSVPYMGDEAVGDGKGGRLLFRPKRRHIPIYLAAMGPHAVSLAYEIADGYIPMFYSPELQDTFFDGVDTHGRLDKVALTPLVPVAIGPDLTQCRNRVKVGLGFFLGAMGTRRHNFYNRFFVRLGFEREAEVIRDFYAAGHRMAAAMAVPDKFVDQVALCGPPERVAERLEVWRSSRVDTMILSGADLKSIRVMAELMA